jgi:hypothetical protein
VVGSAVKSDRLLIEALAISGRFAVLDELTTRMLPHSFGTLQEAERYVDLLTGPNDTLGDPEAAATAVLTDPLLRLLASHPATSSDVHDTFEDAEDELDDDSAQTKGWATVSPDHARVGRPLADWMTTYPHRRADSPTELAEHMERLSTHGKSFALVAFANGQITEVARVERAEDEGQPPT